MSFQARADGEGSSKEDDQFQWELCRENIKPLRSGRRVAAINEGLSSAVSRNASAVVKEKYDELCVECASDADPLKRCLEFIRWFDETFPFGRQRLAYEYLWKIVAQYALDSRYVDDERMLRVWDKMAENSLGNGWSVFQHANTIGSLPRSAKFYVRWAKNFELAGNVSEARRVFRKARNIGALPNELLNSEEDELEMREMRREADSKKDDSWQAEDDVVIDQDVDENGERVAFTRLQGLGPQSVAPVVRLPEISGQLGSSRLPIDASTCSRNSATVFEVFNDSDEEERNILQSVYEMDNHIEHIHLTDPQQATRDHIQTMPLKKKFAPACAFTIYEEGKETVDPDSKKPRLMVGKRMRDISFEEVRAQRFFDYHI